MQDIHDIRPPVLVGMDPMVFWILLATILGIGLIGLIVFLVRKRLKKRVKINSPIGLPDVLPPYKIAMNALKTLKESTMADARLFYFELTMVLRQYLDASFNSRTCEMTSQQFVKMLSAMDLDQPVKQAIIHFVTSSDPIKYGGVMPDQEQVKKDISLVEAWVDQIETRLDQNRQQQAEGA